MLNSGTKRLMMIMTSFGAGKALNQKNSKLSSLVLLSRMILVLQVLYYSWEVVKRDFDTYKCYEEHVRSIVRLIFKLIFSIYGIPDHLYQALDCSSLFSRKERRELTLFQGHSH